MQSGRHVFGYSWRMHNLPEEFNMNGRLSTLLLALLLSVPLAVIADAVPMSSLPGAQQDPVTPACLTIAQGLNLAQVAQTDCCKGHKGICGCRAGKIVCCDNTTSKEPGCTCHGDEGIIE